MKGAGVVIGMVAIAIMVVFCLGTIFGMYLMHPPQDEWQAALDINNWTNRTLDIDIYLMSNSTTMQLSTTIDNECNSTLTITWRGDPTVLVVLHCVGPEIDAWLGYLVDAGEWKSIVLW